MNPMTLIQTVGASNPAFMVAGVPLTLLNLIYRAHQAWVIRRKVEQVTEDQDAMGTYVVTQFTNWATDSSLLQIPMNQLAHLLAITEVTTHFFSALHSNAFRGDLSKL